jgi:hypothetical protein
MWWKVRVVVLKAQNCRIRTCRLGDAVDAETGDTSEALSHQAIVRQASARRDLPADARELLAVLRSCTRTF